MSSFTNFGSETSGNGVNTRDLIAFTNAYSELVAKLERHIADTASSSSVHDIKSFVDDKVAELKKLIPSIEGLLTESDADKKYMKKEDKPKEVDLSAYALKSELDEYIKKNDLESNEIIEDIYNTLNAIQASAHSNTLNDAIEVMSESAAQDIVNITERINLGFKQVQAPYGGTNKDGPFYILGMVDAGAGTAYIKYKNTETFAAVVHFAVTTSETLDKTSGKKLIDFVDGQVDIVSNINGTSLKDVNFFIVKGTAVDSNSVKTSHVYLAIASSTWSKRIDQSGSITWGVFPDITFECSGINFIPVGTSDYAEPVADSHVVLSSVNMKGVNDRLDALENRMDNVTGDYAIGTVSFWPYYDDDGIATNVPSWAHACDGTEVKDPELAKIIGSKYPLQDYSIVRISKVANP